MPVYYATVAFVAKDDADAKAFHAVLDKAGEGRNVVVTKAAVTEVSPDAVTVIYTDGGCLGHKDGTGAWAFVANVPGHPAVEVSGVVPNTTNNRMELLAILRALEYAEIGERLLIISDSEYAIKGITEWSKGWARKGWVTSTGQPVMHQDLWEQLIALYDLHQVQFQHVKGHSGVPGNERCDALCTEAIKAYKKAHPGSK